MQSNISLPRVDLLNLVRVGSGTIAGVAQLAKQLLCKQKVVGAGLSLLKAAAGSSSGRTLSPATPAKPGSVALTAERPNFTRARIGKAYILAQR